MTWQQRKQALGRIISEAMQAELVHPAKSYAAQTRDKLIDMLAHGALTPIDVINFKDTYFAFHHKQGTDHAYSKIEPAVHQLCCWDHVILQRWWRSWMKYRRLQRFIRQPRYSAYLHEEGHIGRRLDIAAVRRWLGSTLATASASLH